MASVFISHCSEDDVVASSLEAWLIANGFTDLFVDHHSIVGGEKWRETLRASAGSCRVILCLISRDWLGSHECFNEFRAGWYMGKRIIPLFLLPPDSNLDDESKKRFAELCADDQGIDLLPCVDADGSLRIDAHLAIANRLRMGLRAAGAIGRVGLDPQAFPIDKTIRPIPFAGLSSFGDADADAALFYGRSREITETLEELRKARAERDPRPFVILGESGVGKSSLLKAGIIPRLRHEVPGWLPLRAFRPGADPLLNFAEALSRTLADFGAREAQGVIRDRLFEAWSTSRRDNDELTDDGLVQLEAALESEGTRLRTAADRGAASILISVDQAEEIARAQGKSAEALADYLRVALASGKSSWKLVFTVRTDSFPELQRHRRFQNLRARAYDLRAIPTFRFESVVEEPAKRYGVHVDIDLADALMEDAPKDDALPLLAFALQRLWHQYAASGTLTRKNYERVGGLKGLIEDAAERALRGLEPEQDVPLPTTPPSDHQVALAASTFVPALAQANEKGAIIRRHADWAIFTDEQHELLLRFARWRLVVRRGQEKGAGVEVAHEALFREWSRLQGWLQSEQTRLAAFRSLQIDGSTWNRNARDAAFLNHRGKRLTEARALAESQAYRTLLTQVELEYLAACELAETWRRRRSIALTSILVVLAIFVVAGSASWLNQKYLFEQSRWFFKVRPYLRTEVSPFVLTPDVERTKRPLDSFRECRKDCPLMIVLPAGEFTMGSPNNEHVGENERADDEGPQHRVTISKPFAVSKFEVTFDDWDVCVTYGDCRPVEHDMWGRGQRPVISINWHDAQQYVAWLSQVTGKRYRLLSEAEWEYAARAGTTTAFPWGDQIGQGNANCTECGSRWGNQTAPVGSFPPNAFGLHDMHGNVWEWVADCYFKDYSRAPSDGSAFMPKECASRVVRGGGWWSDPVDLRSAARYKLDPNETGINLGFRIARDLGP